jgi:hypothetical protein
MLNRHNARFNEREWACQSVQAPLGTIILARRLPTTQVQPRTSGSTTVWTTRRFALRIEPDSTGKKARSRRGL